MARNSVSFLLTLVRHGQTEANKSFIIQGHQDVPLSDDGRGQARRLAAHFREANLTFDTVFSSDLCRALETCQILMGSQDSHRIVVDDRLRERSYGVFEGKNLQDLRAAAKAAGFNDKNYSSFIPPGAELLEVVRNRIQDFCYNTLIVNATPGQKVLLVTHGGVIREFMRFFRDHVKCQLPAGLHEPLRVTPNTGVNCFRIFYSSSSQSAGKTHQAMTRVECLKVHDISHLEPQDDSTGQPLVSTCDSQSASTADPSSPAALSMSEVVHPLEAL